MPSPIFVVPLQIGTAVLLPRRRPPLHAVFPGAAMIGWKKVYGTDWAWIIKLSVTVLTLLAGSVGAALWLLDNPTRIYP